MNTSEERLKGRLASMPPVLPAADLWPRLERARQRRVTRLKTTIGASAVVLLCAALLPLLGGVGNRQVPAPLVTGPQTITAPRAALDQDTLEQIRALDRALQTAYDEGASDDEVEPLWRARRALLPNHASASNPITSVSTRS